MSLFTDECSHSAAEISELNVIDLASIITRTISWLVNVAHCCCHGNISVYAVVIYLWLLFCCHYSWDIMVREEVSHQYSNQHYAIH